MSQMHRKAVTIKLRPNKSVKEGKTYVSYEVTIPKHIIEELGWNENETLVLMTYEYKGKKALLIIPLNDLVNTID